MSAGGEALLEQVRQLMASVFDLPPGDLPPNATPDNTRNWDSLSHMALIAALESRSGLRISHEDAVTLLGDREIADYLVEKNAEFSA